MYEYRKSELLKYLQFYLSKKLRMEVVIRNIINRLKQNKRLSINQFNSIIKFIERENNFISMSREQIFDYFDCFSFNIGKSGFQILIATKSPRYSFLRLIEDIFQSITNDADMQVTPMTEIIDSSEISST